jgi:hypothetical protein
VHRGLNYNHLFDSAFFNAEFGLNDGIQYYRELFGKRKMAKELLALENFQNKLHTIAIPC